MQKVIVFNTTFHRQRTQSEDNNTQSTLVNQSQTSDQGYSVSHFVTHPSNAVGMPTLVSRGPSEHPAPVQQSQQAKHHAATNRVALKMSHPVHNVMPVHNPNQITMSYGHQAPSYVHTYQPYNQPNVQQCQIPITNIQPLPARYPERLEAMNTVNHNSQPAQNLTNDFTNPSHRRFSIYFHLKCLFPEKHVRAAMTQMPHEMEAETLCKAIMSLSLSTNSRS